ncbi:glutamine amidotransferase [Mycolicibacterium brisbanense]
MPRLLLLGESWTTHMIHQKGFDTFTTTEYVEGAGEFIAAMRSGGWDVTHVPAHKIETDCPRSAAEFSEYDVVVISDVGANTFLLTRAVFNRSHAEPNRLAALREYVESGGGLAMIGGYLSFSGVDAKANYANSPIGDILAVAPLLTDDRAETPEGAVPTVTAASHPALAGTGETWPALLGFNRTNPHPDSEVLAEINGSPLVAVRSVKAGRSVAFTSDMSPHWAPPSFVAWEGYAALWLALMGWAADRTTVDAR